jgi:hypothetical protein
MLWKNTQVCSPNFWASLFDCKIYVLILAKLFFNIFRYLCIVDDFSEILWNFGVPEIQEPGPEFVGVVLKSQEIRKTINEFKTNGFEGSLQECCAM